jgi:hypothetical protein
MDSNRFDSISRFFAERRSRRQSVKAAAFIAAGTITASVPTVAARAQEATPDSTPQLIPPPQGPVTKTQYLYVQSFQRGSIADRTDDGAGDHTITLEQGLGQTIYFSNRPERIVGATPTLDFLRNLGFSTENPPNAALLIDTGDGAQEIAVVELFNPHYDPETATATYDLRVLEQWEAGVTFAGQPKDLSEIAREFETAHLFIDDCAPRTVSCASSSGEVWLTFTPGEYEFCSYWGLGCFPCNYDSNRQLFSAPDSVEGWNTLFDSMCTNWGQQAEFADNHYCDDGCYVVWGSQDICPPGIVSC